MILKSGALITPLILALVLASTTLAEAKEVRCDDCRKTIAGQYRIYDGKNLHDRCYKLRYALYCDLCAREISGSYSVFEGKNLHESCYEKRYALRCTLCRQSISGPYSYNSWGDTLHSRHNNEYPKCEYCNRLIFESMTGIGVRLPDGREVCGKCNALAIQDIKEARAVMEQVLTTLSVRGIDVGHNFDLHLVDRSGMSEMSNELGHEAWGVTEFELKHSFFGLIEERYTGVTVLEGLPQVTLMGVLAHELMHVWLFANASPKMEKILSEGSCEYASYLVLKDMTSARARQYLAHQMASEDLVYGTGFREMLKFVAREGLSGWLDYLRNNTAAPWN